MALLAALLAAAGCGEGLREPERKNVAEWPMYGGNPAHTACSDQELSPPFEPKWSHQGGRLEGGASLSRDRLFIADVEGKVWCLHHDSGELDWVFKGDGPFRGQTPLVHDKRVFLVSERGTLYCLDALGGRRLWQKDLGPEASSSAVAAEGRIYLSHGKALLCYDARSGELVFRVDPPGASTLTAPALYGDRVFVGTDTKGLLCLDAVTGMAVWTAALETEASCAPVVAAEGVLIGTSDNRLSLVDRATGNAIWSAHLVQPVRAAPAVCGSQVFVGVGERESLVPATVYCLDMAGGRVAWSYETDLYGSLHLSADNSHVFVHGGLVLEKGSGRRLMSQQVEGNLLAPPVPYDGRLYVCSPGGTLTCLGPVSR